MKYHVALHGREIEVVVDGHDVTIDGRTVRAALEPVPGTPLRQLVVDGRTLALPMTAEGRGRWLVTLHGERLGVEVIDERTRHIRSLTGGGPAKTGAGTLRAPMPGLVVRVQVEPGQQVAAGAPLVVLEAMKMENQLRAPAQGVVSAVLVTPGDAVEKGRALVEFGGAE